MIDTIDLPRPGNGNSKAPRAEMWNRAGISGSN